MAYTKTNWVDNVTPIDKDNLNKIEQGIYDNSLVVDAITNTLNPTDTETYKTAELTEGQITDVIGVNDIVIKGQTSQDGEPTPSSPVDVNVVSGSNVVNTSNKNLFDKDTKDFSKGYYLNNEGVEQAGENWGVYYIRVEPNKVYSISGCQTNGGVSFCWFNKNKTFISYIGNKQNRNNMTAPNNAYYLGLSVVWNITSSAYDNNIMLEQNSTATTYEPHQGKELPLDLPVENLWGGISTFSKTDNGIEFTTNPDGSVFAVGTSTASPANSMLVNEANTNNIYKTLQAGTYTITWNKGDYNIQVYSLSGTAIANGASGKITFSLTETTDVFARVLVSQVGTTLDTTVYIQLEQGSKANAYTPYGTDPIELCKIGDYQDYFYKSGSKWYLHKEIGKVILNGTENWNIVDNTQYSNSILRFSTSVENKKEAASLSAAIPDLLFCDKFKISYINYEARTIEAIAGHPTTSQNIGLFIDKARLNTEDVSGLKTWLASNNIILYCVLETSTDTEITDTTLISQLEAIYNAPLYEETNITQTNNDLPMVLDITACKDNINGIKAFIRK